MIKVDSIIINKQIYDGRLDNASKGIALGGAVVLIINIVKHWSNIDENIKHYMLTGGLLFLISLSYIFSNQSKN